MAFNCKYGGICSGCGRCFEEPADLIEHVCHVCGHSWEDHGERGDCPVCFGDGLEEEMNIIDTSSGSITIVFPDGTNIIKAIARNCLFDLRIPPLIMDGCYDGLPLVFNNNKFNVSPFPIFTYKLNGKIRTIMSKGE